jgi:hypothetical protein
VNVKRQPRLSASVLESPDVVIAGEVWQSRLQIVNNGNCGVVFHLVAHSIPEADVAIEPPGATLAPAQSAIFIMRIMTDGNLSQLLRQTVDVEVSPVEVDLATPSIAKTLSFDVVPWVTGNEDLYHRIPSKLRLVTAIEDEHSSFQVDLSASGSLDEAGSRRVGFLIRGPDNEHVGRYGRRDAYWFSYEDGHRRLLIGDRTYRFSHLTQRFDYGRGAQLGLDTGVFSFGCLYVQSRQEGPRSRRVGGRIAYEPNRNLTVAWNLLFKTDDQRAMKGYTRSRATSIEASVSHGEKVQLNLEYGIGKIRDLEIEEEHEPLKAHAYRLEARGRFHKDIRYSFERIYAGPHYTGYYQGATYTIGSLAFPVHGKLRGSFYYHGYRKNPAGLKIESIADKQRSIKAGISYELPRGMKLSLDYAGYNKADQLAPADHDFREHAAVLGLGKGFSRFSLNGNAEYGIVRDHLTDSPARELVRSNLSVHLRPTSSQSYTIFTRFGDARFSEAPDRDWSVGLSARLKLGRIVRFNVDYVTSRKEQVAAWRRNSLSSTLSIDLPNGHTCSLRGHYFERTGDRAGSKGSMFLTYGIPFGVPTGKRGSVGTLKGRVFDAELADKLPMPQVILSVDGAHAISREDGKFSFPALRPGPHLLQVEPRSISSDKVTTEKLPLAFDITGGGVTELEIGLVKSCQVSGKVTMYKLANGSSVPTLYSPGPEGRQQGQDLFRPDIKPDDLEEIGGVQILVELSNGKETVKQLTDRHGRFVFKQLRPGTWRIKFHEQGIPDLHRIDHDRAVVELLPGDETCVAARVVPEARPIRITGGGRIRVIYRRQ